MNARIFDDRACNLGEGPLWHPARAQLFWFDILGKRLLTVEEGEKRHWAFDEHVSAAGWIDRDTLLIASQTGLLSFDLESGKRETILPLEADNPSTRSNDGRADPYGGFWIGTMGLNAEPRAGTIYRFFRGEIVPLFHELTIPNAICFSPDGRHAYYTDTPTRRIMRQALDGAGWPTGAAELFADLDDDGLNPDGAVADSEGFVWVACWGAGRVVRFSQQGRPDRVIRVPARQPSCPAFGGRDLKTLFVTSAATELDAAGAADGTTMCAELHVPGQAEHRVVVEEGQGRDARD